jgi:hypothetical protein
MKSYVTIVFGAALAAGLQSACAQQAPEPEVPCLRLLGTNAVALGQLRTFEEERVAFRFRNTGAAPVTLRSFLPTCACVQGSADKLRTPPGEETVVTLVLDPRKARGTFTHSVWVLLDEPAQKRVRLTLSGEVVPLFAGLPPEPLSFEAQELNVAWTNRCTLTAARPECRLGGPQIETDAALQIAVALVTNAAETASYDLTLVLTPLARGRHRASVTLPVEGISNAPPLRLDIQTRVGQALAVSPEQVILPAPGRPLTRQFLLRTDEATANPDALTWDPHLKGLTVQAKPTRRADNLLVTVQFSPEAARRLQAEKDAKLLFHYPKHTSAVVRLVAAEGRAAAPGGN